MRSTQPQDFLINEIMCFSLLFQPKHLCKELVIPQQRSPKGLKLEVILFRPQKVSLVSAVGDCCPVLFLLIQVEYLIFLTRISENGTYNIYYHEKLLNNIADGRIWSEAVVLKCYVTTQKWTSYLCTELLSIYNLQLLGLGGWFGKDNAKRSFTTGEDLHS